MIIITIYQKKICELTYNELLPETDCYKSKILSTSTINDNIALTANTILFSNNTKYYFSIYLTYLFLGLLPLFCRNGFWIKASIFIDIFIFYTSFCNWGRLGQVVKYLFYFGIYNDFIF